MLLEVPKLAIHQVFGYARGLSGNDLTSKDNLGAILALCDWLSRSDSRPPTARSISPITIRTVLMALVKAYEIQGCFQLRNAFNAYGHDHTILVKLASTAVSAWILGLTEEQALTAISHVFMDGSPLRVFRNAPNTIPRKGWAAGDACSRALQLVFLARKGQPGGRTVLTAPRWGFYANLFGGQSFDLPRAYGSWVMENIFFKCVPAEGHGISAIDATLQQAQRLRTRGLNPATSIVRIRLRTHAACIRIISKRGVLCNAADRDHCVQYMIAVTLLKGRPLEVGDYTDASPWAANSEVDALRERIEVFEDAALTRDYLDPEVKTAANAVSIELRNGEVLDEVMMRHPLGHVEHPDTAKAVREKFWRNMSLRFSRQEVERILEAFEEEDTRVCDWVDLWVRNDIPRAGEIRL